MATLTQLSFSDNQTASVNLSAQGFNDWVILNAFPPTLHKAGGGTEFYDFTGSGDPDTYNGYGRVLEFDDGNGPEVGSSTAGIYDGFVSGDPALFGKAKVGTDLRTFVLYLSRYDAGNTTSVKLSLSDDSASPLNIVLPNPFTASDIEFTLVVQAQANSPTAFMQIEMGPATSFGSVDFRAMGVIIESAPPASVLNPAFLLNFM